jgi:hypothetical protein
MELTFQLLTRKVKGRKKIGREMNVFAVKMKRDGCVRFRRSGRVPEFQILHLNSPRPRILKID